MKAVGNTAGVGGSDLQKRRLRYCQFRTGSHVVVPISCPTAGYGVVIIRDDRIIAVVAAQEKNADQRLVIRGDVRLLLRESVDQAKFFNTRQQPCGAKSTPSISQESSARRCHLSTSRSD